MEVKYYVGKIVYEMYESDNQENLFTPSHTRFDVYIEYGNYEYHTEYQCNTSVTEPTLREVMDCLLMDCRAYEDCSDVEDFLFDFGYTDSPKSIRDGFRAFEGCKKTAEAFHEMFTNDEIEEMLDEIYD